MATLSSQYQELLKKAVQEELKKRDNAGSHALKLMMGMQELEEEAEETEEEEQEEELVLEEKFTQEELMAYISKVVNIKNHELMEVKLAALQIVKLFYNHYSKRKVRIFDPVIGELEKEYSLKELLHELVQTREHPWAALAMIAQHWARGQTAIMRDISYKEFQALMGQVDQLEESDSTDDEQLDEQELAIKRRANQRFNRGRRNAAKQEQKAQVKLAKQWKETAEHRRQQWKLKVEEAKRLVKQERELSSKQSSLNAEAEHARLLEEEHIIRTMNVRIHGRGGGNKGMEHPGVGKGVWG
ncbi:hypothetical protein CYMTET_25730 [Cymbomonas tetramitiformis]|uniref:Uncharacterized protein n=1 Tax=Cymbomonas tetramitiformis TaxID=36881 RepID=A0AAE0FT65_9CHLO|nr:hypothetical protein CYMTET_25730 [Cymbomonas tetramitiformis]|eukprot:gene7404-8816_t